MKHIILYIMIGIVLGYATQHAKAQSVQVPVLVTIINCVTSPDDPRCVDLLNGIEPSAGPVDPVDSVSVIDGVDVYE